MEESCGRYRGQSCGRHPEGTVMTGWVGSGGDGDAPADRSDVRRVPDGGESGVVSTAWWVVSLSVITAFVGGSVVSAATPARELQFVAGYLLASVPAVYVLVTRRRAAWYRPHPFARFVVYLVSLFVAVVGLDLLAFLLVGASGTLARIIEVGAFAGGFATAAWVTFYGGADLAWEHLLAWLDIEW